MSTNFLALGVVISLLGTLVAAIIAVLPFKEAHRLSNVVLAISTLLGVVVGVTVATSATIALSVPYDFKEAVSPLFFNMNFTLDRFAAIFYSVVNGVAALAAIYAISYLPHYAGTYKIGNVNALTALFVFGMQGTVLASNIVGFMFFWEVMSLTSFFLVMAERTLASRKAAMLYLAMTHLGAGCIAAGLFVLSGGALLSTFSLVAYSASGIAVPTLAISLVLLTFGFGSKAGLVPFHVWLPEAHPMAPSHVSALMSGVMLKVALYGFLRVVLFMIPGVPTWLPIVLLTLGLLSAIFGVLYAILERDVKRILAYSSIENMGLIFTFVAVALFAANGGNEDLMQAALFAALFQAIAHAFFKSGLFFAVGAVVSQLHTRSIEDMGGLARRMPQFSMVICVLALAAAAMPPFASFVAEWTFVQAVVGALNTAAMPLIVALLVSLAGIAFVAGLALFAMVKFYAIAFLGLPRTEAAAQSSEPVFGLLLPSFVAAIVVTVFGVLAPKVLASLGALSLVGANSAAGVVKVDGGSLLPLALTIVMAALAALVVLTRYVVSNPDKEREYQTWDCGQPLTARMEYTGTAFSAPIRFFFRFLLRTNKQVISSPVLATNPWIATKRFELTINSVWYDRLYAPFGAGLTGLANLLRRIQSGSIQAYVALIVVALLVTLIIAL